MDSIDRRKELRTRFVNELYETVDGSDLDPVGVDYVAQRVGLDMSKSEDRREALGIAQYLEGKGLVKLLAGGGVVALTHQGVQRPTAWNRHLIHTFHSLTPSGFLVSSRLRLSRAPRLLQL